MYAIKAKGAQDKYMETSNMHLFDASKMLLGDDMYQIVYGEIPCECTYKIVTNTTGDNYDKAYQATQSYERIIFKIQRECDLMNMLDFVIPNPEKLSLNKMIKKITCEFGGQIMDNICTEDIETHIKTNCALFKRQLNHINGKTFVPLTLAPLHSNNLCLPSSVHHECKISIDVYTDIDVTKCKLYGNMYFLNTMQSSNLKEKNFEYVTVQNQYCGVEKMQQGRNVFKVNFNHPVYLMYFWGFDKTKVTNIKFTFMIHSLYDGPIEPLEHLKLYDGPIEPLEHLKLSKGYDVEPVVMFFSHDMVGTSTKSSINFSRIDEARLIIETEQEGTFPFYMVGLNMQPFAHRNGLVGLVYSK